MSQTLMEIVDTFEIDDRDLDSSDRSPLAVKGNGLSYAEIKPSFTTYDQLYSET